MTSPAADVAPDVAPDPDAPAGERWVDPKRHLWLIGLVVPLLPFVAYGMAEWTGIPGQEMIQPEDCAELVRALLRLSPYARVPVVVIERAGETPA